MATNRPDSVRQHGEERYRHLFEHVPIGIFVIDLTAIPPAIVEVNRRAELVYGYSANELVAMPAARLVPDENIQIIQAIVRQVQQSQTVRSEITTRRRDGTRFPARVIAAPDPTDDGHMIVTVEDITAQKQRRNEAQAIEAERRRIAHEIHDGVAQSLAGLRFKSAYWSHLADAAPPDMGAALDEMQAVIADVIVDLRRAVFALRPLDLEKMGFLPALTQLVGDFGDQNQLAARLDLCGVQDALPATYELPLFRIIQEGLNNVGQHADASAVRVRLTVGGAGDVTASLRDDGRGFDPHQLGPVDRDGHFGLRQMRERIVERGGTLDIHSQRGQGTELLISLPALAQGVNHVAD